ncbi:MAG: hypothetical protein ACREC9_16920 [Methylocella sp.]
MKWNCKAGLAWASPCATISPPGGIPQSIIEAGLLIRGEDIAVDYDRFRDRIMFPIHDSWAMSMLSR